ncbi:MAG TPA: hypothetical protein ENG23_05000 [Methanomicrobia archaeon]|nr:hypothetical protein [Methanomicrobia archaeon]
MKTSAVGQNILLCVAVAVSVVASYAAYLGPGVQAERSDIFFLYLHVPTAWICYLAFSISLLASVGFLAAKNNLGKSADESKRLEKLDRLEKLEKLDRLAEVSAVLGLVYGAVALISGAVWAEAAWGAYWNWDPRETTTLILWVAYVGYLSVKRSIGSVEKRAVVGAVYNILAFSTIPLSFLSATLLLSLHPQASKVSSSAPVQAVLYLNLLAATLFFAYLLTTAYSVWSLEDRVEALIYRKGEGGEGGEVRGEGGAV